MIIRDTGLGALRARLGLKRQPQAFLIWSLVIGEWLILRSGRFILGERASRTHWLDDS